jgi:hypothetical protein
MRSQHVNASLPPVLLLAAGIGSLTTAAASKPGPVVVAHLVTLQAVRLSQSSYLAVFGLNLPL